MTLIIGVIIGLILGLTGAGGSVFAVPLLVIFCHLPMSQASGIALGAVAASALYGSIKNAGQRQVLWVPALFLGIGGIVTAPLGQWLTQFIPELWLLMGFNALAIIIALRMLIAARRTPQLAAVVRANPGRGEPATPLCRLSSTGYLQMRPSCISSLIIGGLLVGLLSGLFGVGGGFLIVPLMLWLSQVDMHRAVATSLVIIATISSAGFVGHWQLAPQIDWPLLARVAGGGIVGMLAGQWISRLINNALAQQIFAVALIGVSLTSLMMQ